MAKDDTLFSILLALLLTPVLAIWVGYVLMLQWGWFVVPLGAPPIGMAHAYGLVALAGIFKLDLAGRSSDKVGPLASVIAIAAGALILLIVGAIAHALM